MHLVINALAERGTPSGYGTVRVADLSSFLAVFVTNSLGVALVGQVDELLVADPEFARDLAEAYESVAWHPPLIVAGNSRSDTNSGPAGMVLP
jgi:hypothetical protein